MEMKYLWDIENPKGYNNRMGRYNTNIEFGFIKKHLNSVSKILDLGGGSGRFALPLKKSGYDITVVDLNNDAIEICKERGIDKSYCMDFRDLDESNYDLVLAMGVFLVTPPAELVKTAYKTLKAGGILITVGTNKRSWRYKLHNLRRNKSRNFGEFSLKGYEEIFSSSGFDIIEIKGFNWMPFRVYSNNVLITFISKIENSLRLYRWLNQSPWLLFACKKLFR